MNKKLTEEQTKKLLVITIAVIFGILAFSIIGSFLYEVTTRTLPRQIIIPLFLTSAVFFLMGVILFNNSLKSAEARILFALVSIDVAYIGRMFNTSSLSTIWVLAGVILMITGHCVK